MKFHLIRHGQTYFNMYGKMQGWSDTPLTEQGITDLKSVAATLKDNKFSGIYSSDSGRAIQTAELLKADIHSLKTAQLQTQPAFRESFFGSFEGSDSEEVWDRAASRLGYQSMAHAVKEDVSFPDLSDVLSEIDPYGNAERFNEVVGRFKNGLEQVYNERGSESTEENVLLVTHGNAIRCMTHAIDPRFNIKQEIGNGSRTVIEYNGRDYSVLAFNLMD